ncbi:MAG: isoaspartyl peptidase/L-asparaginase [Ktedonobacterales bacterium]
MALALIVHGGAGVIPQERHAAAQAGAQAAALAGWRILQQGGSALDAVQAAIMVMEDHPGFNAGTGAVLTTDGRAQLDAGLMDGERLDVGAVASVERIKNPIRLAGVVLRSPHVLLVGAGAEQFAQESGMALCDPAELVTQRQYERWQHGYREGDDVHLGAATSQAQDERDSLHGVVAFSAASETNEAAEMTASNGKNGAHGKTNGQKPTSSAHRKPVEETAIHADDTKHGTVGAVAVDMHGHVAAGASTGGIAAKHPGRVGDTPLVGCGYCAEDGLGGVSSTGHGEDFIRLLLARRALDYIARGASAQAAANAAIKLLGERVGGSGGLILLDGQGRVGYARNTPTMAHAYIIEGMRAPRAGV